MSSDVSIERVGVVGAGQMGAGIAEVSRKAGADVVDLRADRRAGRRGPRPHHRVAGAGVRPRASWPPTTARSTLARLTFTTEPVRPGRPPAGDRGDRRGRGRQGQGLRRARRGRHRSRRGAGVEHLEHPDHEDRCGDEESEPRARPALLQPGAGAAARRTGQHAGHHRRGARAGRAVRERGARQEGGALRATGPASSSTRCWCPTCCRRSGWPRPASRPSRTSTRPSSPGCRTRWGRCGCPT